MIGQDKPVPYRLPVQHQGEGIGVRSFFLKKREPHLRTEKGAVIIGIKGN